MLKIFNNLEPFFQDCYRRINIREYAKIVRITPPTAATTLKKLENEGLLIQEKKYNRIFYYANKQDTVFKDLSRTYWRQKTKELVRYIDHAMSNPTVLLYGSLSKAETTGESDVDIAILGPAHKLELKQFEKKLKRKIQILQFDSIKKIPNKDLANNIVNGVILSGRLELE